MDDELKRLAQATVIQAIKDWRHLCDGGKETGDCNWKELEHFFTHDLETYLSGSDISADHIYQELLLERAASTRSMRVS